MTPWTMFTIGDVDKSRRVREVVNEPPLEPRIRHLAFILALTVTGNEDDLDTHLRVALDDGVPERDIREILLQSILFGGFPRAINGFDALEDILGRARPSGGDPVPPFYSVRPEEVALWRERGEKLFATIYRQITADVLWGLHESHPELGRSIILDGYGKILARPELEARARELSAVAALTALDAPRQLLAHMRGARRVGAKADEIRAAVAQMDLYAPEDAMRRALGYCDKLRRELA